MAQMSQEVEEFADRHGTKPEFVVVDYMELLGGAKASGEGYLATEAQSTMLKDWARQEEMRVFVLHQTNRQEKQWMPPTEDSARNAGFTEADFVIGLWRPHNDPKLDHIERLRLKNKIACNVLKNRPYFLSMARHDISITPSLRVWRQEDQSDSRTTNDERTEEPRENPSPFPGA
jgi:replicative DNA helicase